jgi:hypothetical protein
MTDPTPAETPAVPVAPAPAGAVAPVDPAPPKGKGLGVFALILGLLAFLADFAVLVFAIVQIVSLTQNFDVQGLLLSLGGLAAFAVISFFGGIVAAALAVILGLVAAIKNRGRVAGVFGVIFGVLVLVSRLVVGATIGGSGDLISSLFGN